jgi:hypothetical protein
VTKRTTAVLTFAAGCILGGFIGFVWHAPGRASTWTDARGWATFAVIVLGFLVAGYELDLQRRQFAGEVERNKRRDDLLDGQLRQLHQAERFRERAQAEEVDFVWGHEDQNSSFARVTNNSPRPIRRITCRAESRDGSSTPTQPDTASEMVSFEMPGGRQSWIFRPGPSPADGVVTMIKSASRGGFIFRGVRYDAEATRLITRFTDDAGLHWDLDSDLHLAGLDNRDDW